MFCKAFKDNLIQLDHGIHIHLGDRMTPHGNRKVLRWMVVDKLGNSQFPFIHTTTTRCADGTSSATLQILWDYPERVTRRQKDRLYQLVHDMPSIETMAIPPGTNLKIIKLPNGTWVHSVQFVTNYGPAIQWYKMSPNNELSACFRLLHPPTAAHYQHLADEIRLHLGDRLSETDRALLSMVYADLPTPDGGKVIREWYAQIKRENDGA